MVFRGRNGGVPLHQFLIYWKGYGNEHDQWMAEANLPHAKEAIQDYWTQLSRRNL